MNSLGRRDEALKEMDAAIAIAPSSFNKRCRGLLLYFNRRFDEAIAQLMQVEATDPDYVESSRWIARCFEQKIRDHKPPRTARTRRALVLAERMSQLRKSSHTPRQPSRT